MGIAYTKKRDMRFCKKQGPKNRLNKGNLVFDPVLKKKYS